ncbi:MAG: hypothetical protein ACI81L_003485, partial [Verrucomicrobiales bacterium]
RRIVDAVKPHLADTYERATAEVERDTTDDEPASLRDNAPS